MLSQATAIRKATSALIVALALAAPAAAQASAWDKPTLTSPTTIQLDDAHRNLALPQNQDYILACNGKVLATWGLVVWGGHNVVLEHCDYANSSASGAATFKNQTGMLYVHDVHFEGAALSEGIDLQEPGSVTAVLRDVLIDQLHGSYSTNHADCVQTWSGPQRLLVDGLTCSSQYQGMFMLPNQQDSNTTETYWDVRNANFDLDPGGYVWTFGSQVSTPALAMENVYAAGPGQPLVFVGQGAQGMLAGAPPTGDFVRPASNGATGPDEVVDPMPYAGEQ